MTCVATRFRQTSQIISIRQSAAVSDDHSDPGPGLVDSARWRLTLNLMVKFEDLTLDLVFAALSDATRRAVLDALGRGSATVSELAGPHGMSLPGFMKHLKVLEDAGLVQRTKEGRIVRCALSARPMQEAAMWMSQYEKFWAERRDALSRYQSHQEASKAWSKPQPETRARQAAADATMPRMRKPTAHGPARKR